FVFPRYQILDTNLEAWLSGAKRNCFLFAPVPSSPAVAGRNEGIADAEQGEAGDRWVNLFGHGATPTTK
ncbi:MAG TPA: hypothetical protein VJK04_02795, partial [Candidatus Paceibacterota bacterium]